MRTKKNEGLTRVRGFAVDLHTDRLINAGSKLFKNKTGRPSKSKFLRAAVRAFFSKN